MKALLCGSVLLVPAFLLFAVVALLLAWEPYWRARRARAAGDELPEEYAP